MNAQGPKSMVSPETAMLSVFITPWTKPTCIQLATRAACRRARGSGGDPATVGLCPGSALSRGEGRGAAPSGVAAGQMGPLRVLRPGIVPIQDIVRQSPDRLLIPARGEVFESAHPDVARGHAGEDGPG